MLELRPGLSWVSILEEEFPVGETLHDSSVGLGQVCKYVCYFKLDLERLRLGLAKPTSFTLHKIPPSLKRAAELSLPVTTSANKA